MSIKSLINNQQIRIDSHHRGCGTSNDWDANDVDVHMDKIVKSKSEEYKIKIPLNSNRDVTINRKSNEEIPLKIRNEVLEAFKNDRLRKVFIKNIFKAVGAYNSKQLNQEQRTRQALGYIGKAFGLGKIRRSVKNDIKDFYANLYFDSSVWTYVIYSHGTFIISNNTKKWKRFSISTDTITYKYSMEIEEIDVVDDGI